MSIRTRDMTAGRLDRVRLGMSRAELLAALEGGERE